MALEAKSVGYDIIGDIHGQAAKLWRLLAMLGYQESDQVWRHPTRKAVFVGDFIDQGPQQIETLETVKSMVDAKAAFAILGNHEFNAIAFHTVDLAAQGHHHLRPRTESNIAQHKAFLDAVGCDSACHQEWVNWFYTLPLWLDGIVPFRVIHACWHPKHMLALTPALANGNRLTPSLVERGSRKGNWQYEAIEALLKGLEVELPQGHYFVDKHGIVRTRVRVAWWLDGALSYKEGAFVPPDVRALLPDVPMLDSPTVGYPNDMPVFFGHYWQSLPAQRATPSIGCVDYSAGSKGPLVAYRWDGERELVDTHYVTTDDTL
jgi:hypothetical protein